MRYLKTTEIARRFGVSAQAVRKWIANGTLQAVRVGKLWLVPEDELKKAIKSSSEIAKIAREIINQI